MSASREAIFIIGGFLAVCAVAIVAVPVITAIMHAA